MNRLVSAAALILVPFASLASVPAPPDVAARSYVLFDFHSGQVLAEREAHMRAEPASITKVMTDYIAFDELQSGRIKADDAVLISEKAWRAPGSRTFVEVGTRVRLEDLIRGSIIQSGNDATIAIAEHIAGDEAVFAQLMNKHAQRLGMKNTSYSNATGLPDPGLYTTAYDIALLGQALIRDFPDRYPLFKEREFSFGTRGTIRQGNRNLLLDLDPSADGIKTGHTESAGYCLVGSSIRDGRRLIAVVMGTSGTRERAQATKALLDYGFRFFETTQLFGPTQPVQTATVWKGAIRELPVGTLEPVAFSLPRGEGQQLQVAAQLDPLLIAPIQKGQTVGSVTVTAANQNARTIPLVALEDVPAGSWWRRLIDTIRLWFA
ncbi:MAG TPA: D-alanyl-D-alanine carboxypeptidase family protein [Solimonas sp.]